MNNLIEQTLNFLKEMFTSIDSHPWKWVIAAFATAWVILWMSSCSTQYVHCMKYTDGEKTVTIECESHAEARR